MIKNEKLLREFIQFLINEMPEDVHVSSAVRGTKVSTERAQSYTEEGQISAAKKILPEYVKEDLLRLENKLKLYVLAKLYKYSIQMVSYASNQEYLGHQPTLAAADKSIEEIETVNFEESEIIESIKSTSESEDIPISMMVFLISKVVNSISLQWLNGGSGGPCGSFYIDAKYENHDFIDNIDSVQTWSTTNDMSSFFADALSQSLREKTEQIIWSVKNIDGNWYSDLNEGWWNKVKYIYSEMAGKEEGNGAILLGFANSFTTGDLPTVVPDSKMFAREDSSTFMKIFNRAIYAGWTVMAFVQQIIEVGSVAAIEGILIGATKRETLMLAGKRVFWIWIAVAALQISIGAGNILAKVNHIKRVSESVSKIINNIYFATVETVSSDSFLVEVIGALYNEETLKRIIAKHTAVIVSEIESKASSVLEKFDKKHDEWEESRKSEKNNPHSLYSKNYEMYQTYNPAYAASVKQNPYLYAAMYTDTIEEGDTYSPSDAVAYQEIVNFNDGKNNLGEKVGISSMEFYVATILSTVIVDLRSQVYALDDASLNIEKSMLDFKSAIESGSIKVVSDENYANWEEEVKKKLNKIKNVYIPNNNKFGVTLVDESK